jgi:FAD/FMN-containing dehydrogenase
MFTKKQIRAHATELVVAGLLLVSVPFIFVLWTHLSDPNEPPPPPPAGYLDDASRLNETQMGPIVRLVSDLDQSEKLLRDALKNASESGTPVSIGGARHSMGGQTLNKSGIYIDTNGFNAMTLDAPNRRLHVQAGARWRDIVSYLHGHGMAVSVMQTNNDFSVGGTLSVNAHGWQHGKGPVGSTVESFRLMLADGNIKRCSRAENHELFRLAIGGYGLFGVILDVQLKVVPNAMYRSQHQVVSLDEFQDTWDAFAGQDKVEMLYARLAVNHTDFFEELIVTGYAPIPWADPFPALESPEVSPLRRAVFRGSVDSGFGKTIRWTLEKWAGGEAGGTHSRSFLQNEPVALFANRDPERTDILHEYFVPKDKVVDFIDSIHNLFSLFDVDLLNVTIRSVETDTDSVLRYADQPMFALVMLFNQERSEAAETVMQDATRSLIDQALKVGGRYYLPYRLHATKAQFQAAYPQHTEFFAAKRRWDPDELFRNRFYDRYGK